MISKSPPDFDISSPLSSLSSRDAGSSSSSNSKSAMFVSLPTEILEQIYMRLDLDDRLTLLRTCSTLRDIYEASASLQYEFTLQTTAYLDIDSLQNLPIRYPGSPSSSSGVSMDLDIPPLPGGLSGGQSTVDLPEIPPHQSEAEGSHSQSRAVVNVAPLSAFEKNKRLKDREERWSVLNEKCRRPVRVPGAAGVYELQEGIFLMCDDYIDRDEGRPHSIRLIPLPSARDPDVKDPPNVVTYKKLPFAIADLTMDPTQDLIVVSENNPSAAHANNPDPTHRYHLLTLSTFQPHPLAALPTLDFPPFSNQRSQTRQLLQVMDDVLVILVSRYIATPWMFAGFGAALGAFGAMAGMGTEEEIVCWNWKTGKVLSRMILPDNGWFSSFALLTPTTFLLTTTSNISAIMRSPLPDPRNTSTIFAPVIQLYSFSPDPNHPINPVQPLEAEHLDDTTPRPVLLAQMELPKFAHGVLVASFDVRPDPAFPPARKTHSPSSPINHSQDDLNLGKAFAQDPEKGVLVFEVKVIIPGPGGVGLNQDIDTAGFDMFVLRETVVALAKRGEERLRLRRKQAAEDGHSFSRVEETLQWDEWGVENSRIINASMLGRNWVCTCSGYRYVSLVDDDDDMDEDEEHGVRAPPRECDIVVLDFSPYNIRKAKQTLSKVNAAADWSNEIYDTPTCRMGVEDGETVSYLQDIWKDPVTTKLPYVQIRKKESVWANGVMMDDQRIIVVATQGSGGNGDWSNMTQEMTVYCM